MYDSIPVFIGVIALFNMIKGLNISDYTIKLLQTSGGIWILHPFLLKVMNKAGYILLGEEMWLSALIWKILMVCLTIVISAMMTLAMQKNRWISKLIKP